MITSVASREPVLDMVSLFGPWGIPRQESVPSTAGGEGTVTAYFPLSVPTTCTVRRFWWANGTPVQGSLVAALYRDAGYRPGAKVGTDTGSIAQATVNVLQFANPTGGAFVISPGLWWFALGMTATIPNLILSNYGGSFDVTMKFKEATATPPATATPIEASNGNLYLAGFSTVSSP